MIKDLSSLQKKLSSGIDELKGFVQNHRDLLLDESSKGSRERVTHEAAEWHKSRRRLAELESLAAELEMHERNTQVGSVELYWQARVNTLTRSRLLQFLKFKETEYLGRGTIEMGKKLHSLLPPTKLEVMLNCELTDGEILKQWAAAAEANLRLLEQLKGLEEEYMKTKAKSEHWNVAFENSHAAVCVAQFEEAFLTGAAKGVVSYDDRQLKQSFTLEKLANLQKEQLRLASQLEEIGTDCRIVEQMLSAVEEDPTIPPRFAETKLILNKCLEIAQKYKVIRHESAQPFTSSTDFS